MSSSEEKAEGHTTTAKPDEEPDQVGSSQRQGADQLDDLLDDALNDFGKPSTGPALDESQPAVEEVQPESSKRAQASERGAPGKRPARKGQPRGLGFNPLPERTKPSSRGGRDFGAVPPDVSDLDEELSKGLAKLMRELTEVDGQGAREGGSAMPANDLSDTLRALSEQSATLRAASGNAGAPFSSPADIFSDPMFAGLQEQLGQGDAGEGPFGSIADSLFRQLLSKDVLYQPMKDIGERYPEWLAAHRDSLSEEDRARFEEQYRHIQAILSIYEHDSANYTRLFEALQQMQACGQPPQDIVNDLAPGMSFDEDGLPKFGSEAGGGAGCNVQ